MSDTQIAAIAAGNTAPSFLTDWIVNRDAVELQNYNGTSLAAYAVDHEGLDRVVFSKGAGPDWLTVTPDGTLSGIPAQQDVGLNVFTVRAVDIDGLFDTATMTIQTANVFSGTQGLSDLEGLALWWLAGDCTDVPACGGADLDGDARVGLSDFFRSSRAVALGDWFVILQVTVFFC